MKKSIFLCTLLLVCCFSTQSSALSITSDNLTDETYSWTDYSTSSEPLDFNDYEMPVNSTDSGDIYYASLSDSWSNVDDWYYGSGWYDGGSCGWNDWNIGSNPPAPVPEPATMALFGAGIITLATFRRKLIQN